MDAARRGFTREQGEIMPAPVNIEKQKRMTARYSRGLDDYDRYVSEEEAAWRRGVSVDAFRVEQRKTGKPRRYRMTEKRISYHLREVLQVESRDHDCGSPLIGMKTTDTAAAATKKLAGK